MTDGPSDDDVTRLFPILATRARASAKTAGTFRPPRTGIVEQVASEWHHFVVGRRGVGKSMLLLNVASHAAKQNTPAAYIDIETLRDNPYPDVLVRLLIKLIDELHRNLKALGAMSWERHQAKRSLKKLRARLELLLTDPQEATYQIRRQEGRSKSKGFSLKFRVPKNTPIQAPINLGGSAEANSTATTSTGSESSYTRTKLEGLRAEATEFRAILEQAMSAMGDKGALVILDDFYFIRREDQPDVLSYLHQVVKNLGIWLKVGAVEHRLNEFEDGNPPRGLQLTQDAGKVPMDVTLADFDHTKQFLEEILEDVCKEAQVDMSLLVTDGALLRLVLASGGVPRDYVNLVSAALDKASRRSTDSGRIKNRINAEDVNLAAPQFLKQKDDDLRVDAQPEDIERLRSRLHDVLNFCLIHRKTNVFTVEARLLREEQWGRDISALSDLRFFHRFANLTVKSSDPAYVGQRYEGFALDLSAYAATRVRTNEVEFWTSDGFQRARTVSHVYTPKISFEAASEAVAPAKKTKAVEPVIEVSESQISIFDVLSDPEDAPSGTQEVSLFDVQHEPESSSDADE